MNLQDFIETEGIAGVIKQKIPNKTMKKYLNQFKYIETHKLWYDDSDHPNFNNWIDVEGIGYGWLWVNHKNSEKLQRKSVIKHAMSLYRDSKNEMCIRIENGVVDIFLESKYNKCIFNIIVSNKELYCF